MTILTQAMERVFTDRLKQGEQCARHYGKAVAW
jgi:hypothetical protein